MAAIMNVPGLTIIPYAISAERELELIAWVDANPVTQPARSRHRIDLYGSGAFVTGYADGRLCGAVPRMLLKLAFELGHYNGTFNGMLSAAAAVTLDRVNAITVSEYLPGQGLGMHTDRAEAGAVVVGLALAADCVMRLQRGDEPPIDVDYPQRSLMVMADPCRSASWRHEILPVRARRISIVFRRSA